MIRRRQYLKRVAIVRRPPKRRKGDNPEYCAWLRLWPCWICFERYCRDNGYDAVKERARPEVRQLAYALTCVNCGVTEVAHVGPRGLSQKCPDSEAMPLGKLHHLHATAGGSPESHHSLGRNFWRFHGINRVAILAELQELYRRETGQSV